MILQKGVIPGNPQVCPYNPHTPNSRLSVCNHRSPAFPFTTLTCAPMLLSKPRPHQQVNRQTLYGTGARAPLTDRHESTSQLLPCGKGPHKHRYMLCASALSGDWRGMSRRKGEKEAVADWTLVSVIDHWSAFGHCRLNFLKCCANGSTW